MKFIVFLLPILMIGCGKGELGTNARLTFVDLVNDGVNTTTKAINDTFAEADRSADSVITKGNDAKNTIFKNSGNFTESVGDLGEGLLQAPKNIVNGLLDNDDESAKKDRELSNDIEDLELEVQQNYELMLSLFTEVHGDITNLNEVVEENNLELITALQNQYNELMDAIEEGDEQNSNKIKRVLKKVRKLKRKVAYIKRNVRSIQRQLSSYRSQLYGLYRYIRSIDRDQDQLEQEIRNLQSKITVLEQSQNLVETIDPCGDHPRHFDEVILRLESGKLIAYFESGGKRFLTELVDGHYRTTDRQRCRFEVRNGQILDNQR